MGLTQRLGVLADVFQPDSSLNVGIGGAANSSYKLTVTGTTLTTGAATFSSSVGATGAFTSTGTTTNSLGYVTTNTTASKTHRAYTDTSGNYIIYDATLDSNRLTIASTGAATFSNFVAATTNFISIANTDSISVGTSTAENAKYNYLGYSGYWGIKTTTTGFNFALDTYNGGTPKNVLTITQAGNVGIGTSSPATTLNIVGGNSNVGSTTSDYGLAIQAPTSMAEGVGGSILLQGYKTGTSAIGNFAYVAGKKENGTAGNEAGYLSFGTFNSAGVPAERMRITSGGEVLIGGTTTQGAGITVYNPIAGGSGAEIRCTANTGNSVVIYSRMSTVGSASNYLFAGQDSQQDKIYVYGNGNIVNRNGSYGTLSSDVNLKQDIVDANSQWNDIKNLRVVNFRYIEDVEREGNSALRQIGFIAQEVEQVSPSLVYETKSPESEDTWKSIKTSIIHLKAVKALQEAMERIEQLEAKVTALENR